MNLGFLGYVNSFKFSRITKDWVSINHTSDWWMDYAKNPSYYGSEGSVAHGPTPMGMSTQSYVLDPSSCIDERVDVSSLVEPMFKDRSQPSIIKMELINNHGYALDKQFSEEISPSLKVCFQPPVLDVYYYTCDDSGSNYLSDCGQILSQFYCTSYQHRLFCLSKFNQKKSINPYVEGILGNWRVDTSFIYYGDRKESDPNSSVDTRTAGSIANFKTFWNFSNSATGVLNRNISAQDVWTWNSTITQYNRKGYEIESKDPLGRFNSGLYGYNQQLPIAVASNARVREVLFDGFEDYDYQTSGD